MWEGLLSGPHGGGGKKRAAPVAAQEMREMSSMAVAGAGLPTENTHEREEQTPVQPLEHPWWQWILEHLLGELMIGG